MKITLTLLAMSLCFECACMAADPTALPVREKYLLLDDRVLASVENAVLKVGTPQKHSANPLFGADQPWERDLSHMYANVVFDEDERIYRLWYYSKAAPLCVGQEDLAQHITPGPLIPAGKDWHESLLYAVSRDGIKWEKPALDIYKYKQQPCNMLLYDVHGAGVFKDSLDPDRSRRYKLITGKVGMGTVYVAFSADGIHWSERQEVAKARADTHNNAFWAPDLKRYVAFTRGFPNTLRTVLRMDSEDFIHWSEPTEVMRGPYAAQTYSMPVFRYAGVYLGLVAVFRTKDELRVQTELAWSPDTRTWHRIEEGTPFIPYGAQGAPDWGCTYAAATPIVQKDEIRVYYAGEPAKHGMDSIRGCKGFLCLATLRPDGWAGYVEKERIEQFPSRLRTRPLTCSGKMLRVTADVYPGPNGGGGKATILDAQGNTVMEGKPFHATVTDGVIADVSSLTGKTVIIQFSFRNAKIYSFAFGDAQGAQN